ncbi:MAG: methylmalonyl-CoA epimerase [Candidatus Eremiobacteraeota bacterium]|nr:methylmalonyl-CoA epimerase [Candidatus Eremiobacteraeota bacterium]MBV8263575.1 methylmalonyl-CoA epimerase [Candidatus Eremiobacteraeota bacterium]MBV8339532.1 methylmalonyl-CoA epimerase [Candidatus Eremiobacteraeota bacterium]MBV8595124.1 methylmalonyl-CoA epimerase [Candidatus Eremiobacteraeota bacterium]
MHELDHVAVVVADLAESEALYAQLGFSVLYRERVEDQGVDIVGLRAGDNVIELLKPLAGDSPLQRFLGDQRSKLHHLAYRVENIEAELARLSASGVRLIDMVPRRGAHGNRIAFIHPSYAGGTLIELCQPATDHDRSQY